MLRRNSDNKNPDESELKPYDISTKPSSKENESKISNHRTYRTEYQNKTLESYFRINTKPCRELIQVIANDLKMDPKTVRIWFQNKRSKVRAGITSTTNYKGRGTHSRSVSGDIKIYPKPEDPSYSQPIRRQVGFEAANLSLNGSNQSISSTDRFPPFFVSTTLLVSAPPTTAIISPTNSIPIPYSYNRLPPILSSSCPTRITHPYIVHNTLSSPPLNDTNSSPPSSRKSSNPLSLDHLLNKD